MVTYNFKRITVVPAGTEIIDVVLSRTQRKTPTVVHPGFKISRIRKFYMRKVKYTEQTINEKLTLIVQEFPRMDVRAARGGPRTRLAALTIGAARAPR